MKLDNLDALLQRSMPVWSFISQAGFTEDRSMFLCHKSWASLVYLDRPTPLHVHHAIILQDGNSGGGPGHLFDLHAAREAWSLS